VRFVSALLFAIAALASTALFAQSARVVNDNFMMNVMPAAADSNSPAFWRDGKLYLINSANIPMVTTGRDQIMLYQGRPKQAAIDSGRFPIWIESAWQDDDGTLYAWYHHEPQDVCPGAGLTAPEIGALVSYDAGASFTDLGIVLNSGDAPDCSAKNGFFAGGHGDFGVMLSQDRRFFYFLFGNYGGPAEEQGVAIARMPFERRGDPVGAVRKYHRGLWFERGLGGHMTPIFPARTRWQESNADSFWGPSVHWNTHLQRYVVLLNRACCEPMWPQQGIYVAFATFLRDPESWTAPQLLLKGEDIGFAPGFYPQVLGYGPGETDTLVGETGRLYIKGFSRWKITFQR
jgi:hypothetical protein